MIGMVIAGRYELVAELGKGGMGEVFEALDRQTRRHVAVKRLHVGIQSSALREEAAARFRREILATAKLSSRHVVGIHDGGIDDDGVGYMVMDRLVGMDLEQVLERTPTLPQDLALRIVSQACSGLAVAHGHGIVHRDIKPSNLFLVAPNDRGTRILKLLDFGVARLESANLEREITELTRTGALIGSPKYMAPEQLRGAKELDQRADLWSLGAVLYRALAGSLPHDADTLGELIVQVCSVPAPPLHDRAQVPRELSRLVGRLLAIEPADRIASANELSHELSRWLPDGDEIEQRMFDDARPVRSTAPRPSTVPHSPSMLAPPERPSVPRKPIVLPPTEPTRSTSWVKLLVLLALLAVLVVVGQRAWQAYQRSREPPLPVFGPPELMSGMPPDLAGSDGATWFAKVRGHCNSIELRSVLANTPPPDDDIGEAFAAACAGLAGDLTLARTKIAATDDPKYASWPLFAVAHPLADQRNDDPAVANIMRLVLELWPENFQASYHAGVAEFLVRDPRAEGHLRAFLQHYPQDDDFKTTGRILLDEIVRPGDPSCDRVVVIDPEGNRIRPPGCS